jgi:hypothetical protein
MSNNSWRIWRFSVAPSFFFWEACTHSLGQNFAPRCQLLPWRPDFTPGCCKTYPSVMQTRPLSEQLRIKFLDWIIQSSINPRFKCKPIWPFYPWQNRLIKIDSLPQFFRSRSTPFLKTTSAPSSPENCRADAPSSRDCPEPPPRQPSVPTLASWKTPSPA